MKKMILTMALAITAGCMTPAAAQSTVKNAKAPKSVVNKGATKQTSQEATRRANATTSSSEAEAEKRKAEEQALKSQQEAEQYDKKVREREKQVDEQNTQK